MWLHTNPLRLKWNDQGSTIRSVGRMLRKSAALRVMMPQGSGSIVNISSIDGIQSKNGLIAYSASKGAVRSMTKSAAIELGRYGIRVNSVHPGGVDTVMGNPGSATRDHVDPFYARQALPRIGLPDEVARMVLFLASDEASYSTGGEYLVDGGALAGARTDGLPGA